MPTIKEDAEHDEQKVTAVIKKLLGEKFLCDNCRWSTTDRNQLRYIKQYNMRVDVNGPVPDGECPMCGALCYEVDG